MEPPLRPLIQLWEFEGETVLTAEFPELPPESKPCFYRGGGLPNGAFVRVGEGDRKLSAYEVQALLESRGQPQHDLEPIPGTSADDLSSRCCGAFVAARRGRTARGPKRRSSAR